MSDAIKRESQVEEPSSGLLELFVVEIPDQEPLYLHNGNKVRTFQGNAYQPFSLKAEGYEFSAQGVLPRPHITVTKVDETITAAMQASDDLIGTKVTRKRTFYEFLDDQPGANPDAEYEPDVYYIDSVISDLPETVEFELTSPLDNENVRLPRRQMKANACGWDFRGPDCGYTGPPVEDEFGNPLTATNDMGAYVEGMAYAVADYVYIMQDGIRTYYVAIQSGIFALSDTEGWTPNFCQKTLRACKANFGANNPLSFEGFPGLNRLPQTS